jgi:adenosylcobyric acid synthase
MKPQKRVALSHASYRATGDAVSGYEIHLGVTGGPDCARAWLDLDGRPEGAASADGKIRGCYLHGLFSADAFRAQYLGELGATAQIAYDEGLEQVLDQLADHIEAHMDLTTLLEIAAEPKAQR